MQRRNFIGGSAGLALAAASIGGSPTKAEINPSAETAAFTASRRLIGTSFGRIAYVERGKGPAALFLHAWPLNSFEWRGALEGLSANRRCIAPDFMGLGYSEVSATQDLSPTSQADMLAAVLTALGEQQADVVANDSGGLIAQVLAARHPEKVRSLLLTNCDVDDDNPPPSFMPIVKAAQAGALAKPGFERMLANIDAARSPRGLGAGYAHPEILTAASVDYYLRPLVTTSMRQEQLNRYTISLGHNDLAALQPALARFPAPVRIVWGAADTVFDRKSPDRLNQTFPNSKGVRQVPDAKLYFPEERPEIIIEEARKLWTC